MKILDQWEKEAKLQDSYLTGDRILSLIELVRKMHIHISLLRRATDDISELKDINRMVREALALTEDLK